MTEIDPWELKDGDVYLMYTPWGDTYPKQVHISVCVGSDSINFYRLWNTRYRNIVREETHQHFPSYIAYEWYDNLVKYHNVVFFLLDDEESAVSVVELI